MGQNYYLSLEGQTYQGDSRKLSGSDLRKSPEEIDLEKTVITLI